MYNTIEIAAETLTGGVEEAVAEAFLDVLEDLGADGPVVATGAARIEATFGVTGDWNDDGLGWDDCVATAVSLFAEGLDKVGVRARVVRVDVLSEDELERELNQKPETYLGVHEVGQMLKVSRQRLAELRAKPGFPAPIVELAAGPVWAGSSLQRFVDTWERKPGRPRKEPASQV